MIHGRNVTIRPIELKDQSFIHELNSDQIVRSKVVGWDWPGSLAAQEQWFANQSSTTTQRWLVTNNDGEPLGLTGLWDIDWHNRNAMTALKLGGRTPMRGKGYGTDAIMTVMAFAFYDVGLNRLHGAILADNTASMGAYVNKCGWSIEGTARQHIWRHGQFVDLVHVGVLKSDFDALPAADEYTSQILEGNR